MIKFSAPGKIHLLGEHSVVYGKPALLSAINLRVTVTVGETDENYPLLRTVVNKLIQEKFKVKKIPPFSINSSIPTGCGLGFSAASSAAIIATVLSFLKIRWNLNLINDLTYKAEKVFHGNPSGADNATVVFGGLIWYRKETPDLKLIQPLPFSIPHRLAKNFILINTGIPKESTADMVISVSKLYQKQPKLVNKFLKDQETLVKELIPAIQDSQEDELINIIRAGQKNLESIGVCSKPVKEIIRKIEANGGAAKICGGGGKKGPTGILLCYHPQPSILQQIAKTYNLGYFKTNLGVEGLRKES